MQTKELEGKHKVYFNVFSQPSVGNISTFGWSSSKTLVEFNYVNEKPKHLIGTLLMKQNYQDPLSKPFKIHAIAIWECIGDLGPACYVRKSLYIDGI